MQGVWCLISSAPDSCLRDNPISDSEVHCCYSITLQTRNERSHHVISLRKATLCCCKMCNGQYWLVHLDEELQGVYINCQKLKSLWRGKYQLNIVYFGNFVPHMYSHSRITCKILPTMKKSLNITSWINGWFSAWTQNGDFSEWKKTLSDTNICQHMFRVVHTKIYHNYIIVVS